MQPNGDTNSIGLRADTTTSTGEENSEAEDEDNEDEEEVNGSVNMSAQTAANCFYPMQFNSAGYYSDANHSSSLSSIDGWSQL